jgi:hypothetical protein
MLDARYPIGPFAWQETAPEDTATAVDEIAALPAQLAEAVAGLEEMKLDTPYRTDGWTIRQVVHHLADSHMNSYIRFKWALTEEAPLIKTYQEALWAELPEARTAPVGISLDILMSLHLRWVLVMRAMQPADWQRTFQHPELGPVSLSKAAALYAWHGRHHVAHIKGLRGRMGW